MNPSDANDRQMLKLQARRRVIQSRLLMVFAVGSTGMLMCCCVPSLLLQLVFGPREFHKPAEVEVVAKNITPLVLPPNFTGSKAIEADNSLLKMRVVQFDQNDGRGRLVLGEFCWRFPSLGKEFDDEITKSNASTVEAMCRRSVAKMRTLNVKQSRQKVVKIQGVDVTFTIDEGDDEASTTNYKQASGSGLGPKGAFQLDLQVETDFLSQDEVDALLDSLADPAPDAAK